MTGARARSGPLFINLFSPRPPSLGSFGRNPLSGCRAHRLQSAFAANFTPFSADVSHVLGQIDPQRLLWRLLFGHLPNQVKCQFIDVLLTLSILDRLCISGVWHKPIWQSTGRLVKLDHYQDTIRRSGEGQVRQPRLDHTKARRARPGRRQGRASCRSWLRRVRSQRI